MNPRGGENGRGGAKVSGRGVDLETRARLETLHGEVSRILGSQFAAAQEELQQLRHLLEDAAVKLADGFVRIDKHSKRQKELAWELVGDERPDVTAEIRQISDAITEWAGVAVQGLQFEDMSGQLLHHLARRLTLLEEFSVDMSLLRAHLEDDAESDVPGLAPLETLLARHKEELLEWERKAVRQTNLSQGSVELF